MSGLFKMVAQMRNGGFVVEALTDGKRFPVSSSQRIIMLEDISVYTMHEDMPLKDVFLKMKEQDAICSAMNSKSDPADLKSTLKKVIPEFDEERVHASDIKKMFVWYSLLKDIIGTEPEEKIAETTDEKSAEAPAEKPKKAKAVKAKTADDTEVVAEKKPKAPRKTTKKEA